MTLELIFQPLALAVTRPQVVAALLAADGRPAVTLALTENGECELRIHDGASARRSLRPADGTRLQYGRWYRARITADLGPGLAELEVASTDRAPSGPQRLSARTALRPAETGWLGGQGRPVSLVLAAAAAQGSQAGLAHFTGKIEAPVLTAGGPAGSQEVTVSWRLGPARGAVIEDDSGQHAELRLLNTPMTGVTGHCWNGGVLDYRQDPAQYAALAFHADDLTDAGWRTTATIALPETLTSSVYAAKLATADGDRYVPFFVAPAMGTKRNRIAVLLPTFTYLAYANEHVREGVPEYEDIQTWPSRQDLEISAHRDFGLSLYDTHADGTGVCYSSVLRPVLNLDPSYRFWLFGGPVHLGEDLYLLDWLERLGHRYDIVTDHLVHAEGSASLDGYSVVLTGSHPEYASSQLLDALQAHVERGGRLMYLGGNGFYWVTSVDPAAAAHHRDSPWYLRLTGMGERTRRVLSLDHGRTGRDLAVPGQTAQPAVRCRFRRTGGRRQGARLPSGAACRTDRAVGLCVRRHRARGDHRRDRFAARRSGQATRSTVPMSRAGLLRRLSCWPPPPGTATHTSSQLRTCC